MKKLVLFVSVLSLISFGFISNSYRNYLPSTSTSQIIEHSYYTLSFNSTYNQAEWVAYQISNETAFGGVKRSNNFKEDSKLTNTKFKPYYANSGYDRGHLCPAGSMAFNETAMNESFYMTNMSPQVPGFNRGIWKKLETQVRTWGYENDTIYIVTGPILTEFIDTIGEIPVPKYFYKIILDNCQPELKAIAFVMENASSSSKLTQFAVTIDSVETLTGIDFFSPLPDSLEDSLESSFDTKLWSWKPVKVAKTHVSLQKFQCIATTSSGSQCSRMIADSNNYCWQHKPDTDPTVWVCGNSKIYHTASNHSGLKRCTKGVVTMSLSLAVSLGKRACKDK